MIFFLNIKIYLIILIFYLNKNINLIFSYINLLIKYINKIIVMIWKNVDFNVYPELLILENYKINFIWKIFILLIQVCMIIKKNNI